MFALERFLNWLQFPFFIIRPLDPGEDQKSKSCLDSKNSQLSISVLNTGINRRVNDTFFSNPITAIVLYIHLRLYKREYFLVTSEFSHSFSLIQKSDSTNNTVIYILCSSVVLSQIYLIIHWSGRTQGVGILSDTIVHLPSLCF